MEFNLICLYLPEYIICFMYFYIVTNSIIGLSKNQGGLSKNTVCLLSSLCVSNFIFVFKIVVSYFFFVPKISKLLLYLMDVTTTVKLFLFMCISS